jgi:glycosyltransferase involved in cell wall biosynthesis
VHRNIAEMLQRPSQGKIRIQIAVVRANLHCPPQTEAPDKGDMPDPQPAATSQGHAKNLRILIVTDAWAPQVNGVVRTLETLGDELKKLGHTVQYITPKNFTTLPTPTYPEIRLAVYPGPRIRKIIDEFQPDAIHIATEGTIGLAARNHCVRTKRPFTTSFHTKFPEYVHARFRVPVRWTYALIRWFHKPATSVMVATRTLQGELEERGFRNLKIWSRGVDTEHFKPGPKDWLELPRPVFLYVGRVAVEKNIEAFLSLELPGSKLVIGDGPQMAELQARFPGVTFIGPRFGADLARYYSASDVFVFPSRTDTFGLVVLEALASGVPVAAYPVLGPKDIIGDAPVGCLSEDLKDAALKALTMKPDACRGFAESFSWRACTGQFLSNLAVPIETLTSAQRSQS